MRPDGAMFFLKRGERKAICRRFFLQKLTDQFTSISGINLTSVGFPGTEAPLIITYWRSNQRRQGNLKENFPKSDVQSKAGPAENRICSNVFGIVSSKVRIR